MNWKKFLKPKWEIYVIFLCLVLLIPWIIEILTGTMTEPHGYPSFCYPCQGEPLFCYFMGTSLRCEEGGFILSVIWIFILPYIISCLAIWLYDKFRKKNKK